ncbi:MAG: hypothetical protein ACI9F9_000680 [Candidatus Paceibacteria bacterium]|jgi:hypothetical protein
MGPARQFNIRVLRTALDEWGVAAGKMAANQAPMGPGPGLDQVAISQQNPLLSSPKPHQPGRLATAESLDSTRELCPDSRLSDKAERKEWASSARWVSRVCVGELPVANKDPRH